MKFSILVDMLFDLLSKRKITAAYLAEKYKISPRTVYRYIELLATKLPLSIKRGRNGGICLSDAYRLPVGFMSAEEYSTAIEALVSAYALKPESRFLEAKRKLSAQVKTEKQTLAVSGEVGDLLVEDVLPSFSEKTRILAACIRDTRLAEIEYFTDEHEKIAETIEPHALLLRKGTWHVYVFSHQTRNFQLLRVARIFTLIQTDTLFRKRPFEWSALAFQPQKEKYLSVQLAIAAGAIKKIRDRLGVETLQKSGEHWTAEVKLPEEEAVQMLLSLGKDVTVLSPLALRKKLQDSAKEIAKLYD